MNVKRIEASSKAIQDDEEFIRKMNKFNTFVNEKKIRYQQFENDQQSARNEVLYPSYYINGMSGSEFTGPIEDTGSIKQIGLAHKNLNQIYGRVR